ncbi:MAG: glycosyltransferase family 4 protein [Ruminococcaceae bacterium]|nr:glycosyltransferase family 4 protein [Oscillospiraceae bacterium]
MRILLDDGMQLGVGTGIGNYARYLGESLAACPDTEVVREDFAARGSRRAARLRYLHYLESAAYREKLSHFDVVHYANYAMPRKTPHGTLTAVTVHDLTAFSHRDTLPRAYAAYNRAMVRRAVKHADLILTVSNAIREELIARFPDAAHRTHAVYPGHYDRITAGDIPPVYENKALTGLENRKFFLFVGTVERRKNLGTLISAFSLLTRVEQRDDLALVLAGRDGFGAEAYHALAARTGADIRFTGYLSESDLKKLYREATAFVFPSIYEGFGSPQTECMSCGLPLLLSDIPTNREISGDYGAYFPTDDPEALMLRMRDLLNAPPDRNALRAVGKVRLAPFSWHAAAEQIRALYGAHRKN